MDLNDGKSEEARKILKEAHNLTNPKLFGIRLKADWSSSTPLYERAAQLFRQAGDPENARKCWELAATGHRAQRSGWNAAKALERAAEMAERQSKLDDVEMLYKECAELYVEEDRPQVASEALTRGAKCLSDKNPDVASNMYCKAIEWLEESGRDGTSPETYRQAISHSVKTQRWDEAVQLSLKFATSCYKARAISSMCKAYLGAIVIWLHALRGDDAWRTYQDALSVEEFMSSDQAFAAEALFSAYCPATSEGVALVITQNSAFRFLDSCIARLAKGLPRTDIRKTSEGIGATRVIVGEGYLNEDDLT